ncbi:MAG TPA: hypothetical protein ENN90_15165 [Mariniphaga anaerophila]|uniref:Uncharacterized protein n=1 Tax=Mariniphaga anaerophila TaxID=1484053 RepID=A0A831LYT9_9BACT|nr:hypothetical protein [Mariniphaga anaerophila]
MATKYNIRLNSQRHFQVRLKIVTIKGKTGYQEIKIEAKTAKAAGHEAENILRENPNIKTARWLFIVDENGTIHY